MTRIVEKNIPVVRKDNSYAKRYKNADRKWINPWKNIKDSWNSKPKKRVEVFFIINIK